MDKTAIKNFAVWARRKLIEDIQQKAYEIGITENGVKEPQVVTSDAMIIGDRTLNKAEMNQRKSLVSRVKEKGFNNVVEEVAYTWFNRFIALRFMEVNEYLPTGVRVLSSNEPGKKEPDIIKEALNTDLDLDRELVYRLQDSHDSETLYRYLLVKQCNALNEILPGLFEEIEDYTEMLLPSNLLAEGSVIRQLADNNIINDEDFKDEVEIIGWMYQYYISEKKDEVFEGLKKNIKITKENIPAATQLFTPDWIVKYMVENSLGRLWLESHPDEQLKSNWKYYLDEAEQEPEVQKQLNEIWEQSKSLKPEEITVLDPCMGSGHILVYAFDVLYEIYKNAGYSERDIPKLILEKNLYGLDIDDRAAQLSYFALMMKARSKSRRIFRDKVSLNVCAIQESNGFPKEAIEFLVNSKETELEKRVHNEDVEYLINVFFDAKEYGAILDVKPIDFDAIERRIAEIRNEDTSDLFEYQYRNIVIEKLPALIRQAKLLNQKYDVCCINPPYMAIRGVNSKLSNYISSNYREGKSDLYSAFIIKGISFLKEYGYNSMVTMQAWMFLSSFEELRKYIFENFTIFSLLQIGYNSFPSLNSQVAHAAAFTIMKSSNKDYLAKYFNLNTGSTTADKEKVYLSCIQNSKYYLNNIKVFEVFPGMSFAYSASDDIKMIFSTCKKFGDIAKVKQGMTTSDNERFLRLWWEVDLLKVGFNFRSSHEAENSGYKWFPYNKGGPMRKWYGNNEFVVNYENDGREMKEFHVELNKKSPGGRIKNSEFYFNKALTWSKISTDGFTVRYIPNGFIFDVGGSSIFDIDELYELGFLNSKVAKTLLNYISPTINYEAIHINSIPIKQKNFVENVHCLVKKNIAISKADWDSKETSWDFKRHPLIEYTTKEKTIKHAFINWNGFALSQFNTLKSNEQALNKIFIELYNLGGELKEYIDDKEITIGIADNTKDIKSFISYIVGCMLGRYSICEDGIICADCNFSDKWRLKEEKWKTKKTVKDEEGKVVEDTWVNTTFAPDMDNVLPITDDEYFEDDIINRFIEFLKITFSDETLEENLDYIADTLGRKSDETSRQTLRRYFIKDFYKDHIQTYQKRPIYWLFDSGKQDGFKALIYMHRYDEFTVAKVRTDYLHKLQKSYEAEIKRLDIVIDSSASEREKANARKKKEKIFKQIEECRQYDQIIAHLANQRIQIDLDDGVSVNYAKFQGIEIPQGDGKKPMKADLLAKL